MTKARDLSKLLSTANGKIAGANLDVSFENITDTGTEGTRIATGTTGQRGSTAGQLRFNSDTGLAEYYNGSIFKSIDSPPTVSSIDVTEVDSQAGGNQTIVITGSGFGSGATVTFVGASGTDFNASTVTVDSITQITAVAPKASFLNAQEPYGVKVTNVSNLSATLTNQINVDSSPSWITASGTIATINSVDTGTHTTVSATDYDGDTVSYSETGGTVLSGAGLSLNSSTGAISGDPTDVNSPTTNTFTLRATANSKTADRSFNIIVNPIFDGSTSAKASGSPYQIATITGSAPTNGVYWFQNSGYNSGNPFQAYADWSIANYNTNGIIILSQQNLSGTPTTNFTDLGTASTSVSGTRGHGNDFREPSATILSNWSGDTANRGIVGQYRQSTGTSLGTASYSLWIEISKSPLVFKTMFDDIPGGGEFTGTISARSVGGTGSFYWARSNSGEYPNHLQMANSTSEGNYNADMYLEYKQAGADPNHSFHLAPDGNGDYANSGAGINAYNGGSQNRVGWFGFSPNNVRT
jgi:hypothetical protein